MLQKEKKRKVTQIRNRMETENGRNLIVEVIVKRYETSHRIFIFLEKFVKINRILNHKRRREKKQNIHTYTKTNEIPKEIKPAAIEIEIEEREKHSSMQQPSEKKAVRTANT